MERIRSIDFVIVYARVRPIGALHGVARCSARGAADITHAFANAWGVVVIGRPVLTTASPIPLAAFSWDALHGRGGVLGFR